MRIILLLLFLGLFSSSAFGQPVDDLSFDNLFEKIDIELTQVIDRSVLDSTESEINPKVAELCNYIEGGQLNFISKAFNNPRHTFFEKATIGTYYTKFEALKDFRCKQKKFGGYEDQTHIKKFSLIEMSVMHAGTEGMSVFDYLFSLLSTLKKDEIKDVLLQPTESVNSIHLIQEILEKYSETLGIDIENDLNLKKIKIIQRKFLSVME